MDVFKISNFKKVFVSLTMMTLMLVMIPSISLTAFAEDDGWNDIDFNKAGKCANSAAIGGAAGGALVGALTGGTMTFGTLTVPAAAGGAITGAAGGYASGFVASVFDDLQK